MISLEFMRYPSVSYFAIAFFVEAMVTWALFLARDNIKVSKAMKWWAICALMLVSFANLYAGIETFSKPILDRSLFTKLFYCTGGLVLLAWVHYFHKNLWKKQSD